MHILQVSKKMPYPPLDGESLGIHVFTQAFARLGHQVSVLAMNTPKHTITEADFPKNEPLLFADYEMVFVDTSLSFVAAFINLFSKKSYNVERFVSKTFRNRLAERLQQTHYDLIELESAYLIPYSDTIRKHSSAPIVVRLQNVEAIIWERLANETRFLPKKWYLKMLARRMKRFEHSIAAHCDAMLPVSPVDKAYFRDIAQFDKPMFLLPFCLHAKDYPFDPSLEREDDFPSLFFLGAMDWDANRQGLIWFLENAWHLVKQQLPNANLYIAGRGTNQEHKQYFDRFLGVKLLGEVPSAPLFMRSKAVMIVPLLSGSGMRVKIIEGMALGKPIVATSVAAEGIDCTNGQDIWIADTPADFAQTVCQLLTDRQRCIATGNAARSLVEQKHDVMQMTQNLLLFYDDLIAKKRSKNKIENA